MKLSLCLACAALPDVALAQTSEGASAADQDIVVTARRRAESIRDVPISISAIGAEAIEARGLRNAEDYLRGIPGTNQVDGVNGQSIVIRGIETSTVNQNFGSGAATATYFGETPTTNSAGLASGTNVDIQLIDVERVEVLRGPQGTSFGDSSLGGAVRVLPQEAKLSVLSGRVAAGYGLTGRTGGDNYSAQAVLNVPLSDVAAVRGVLYHSKDSGFYRNRAGTSAAFRAGAVGVFGGADFARDASQVGDREITGGRVSVVVKPTDRLRLAVNFLKQVSHVDGNPIATTNSYDQELYQIAPEHVVRGRRDGVSDTSILIVNPRVEYDLEFGTLLATYSHSRGNSTVVQPFQVYGLPWPLSFFGTGPHKEDVGELRFSGKIGSRINLVIGGFLQKATDDTHFNYIWFGDPATNFFNFGGRFTGDYRDRRRLKQTAFYGEVSWEFVRDLTLTAGARYYDYTRRVNIDQSGGLFGGASTLSNKAGANGVTPRANLSAKIGPDILAYAGWSRGFRLGKPQPGLPAGLCDRDGNGAIDGTGASIASTRNITSDKVDNYEAGIKASFLDRRVQLDAAVFRMDWSNIPVRVTAPPLPTGCGLTYNANAGTARSEGVELQLQLRATDNLRFDLGGSYINARLTEDAPAENFFAGDRLPGAPKWNANAGVQVDFPLGGRSGFVRADATYVGRFYDGLVQASRRSAGDYVKLDLSARAELGRHVALNLYVRNVTNEDAFTYGGPDPTEQTFLGYRLRPRTIGAEMSYNF